MASGQSPQRAQQDLQPGEQQPEDPTSSTNGGTWENAGYNTWVKQRTEWTQPTAARPAPQRSRPVTLTYQMVLGEQPFPKPVPLEAVVEYLVEMWEEEEGWD